MEADENLYSYVYWWSDFQYYRICTSPQYSSSGELSALNMSMTALKYILVLLLAHWMISWMFVPWNVGAIYYSQNWAFKLNILVRWRTNSLCECCLWFLDEKVHQYWIGRLEHHTNLTLHPPTFIYAWILNQVFTVKLLGTLNIRDN